jgi:hypothetical protein
MELKVFAIVIELADGGLDQANASIVAVMLYVLLQGLETGKLAGVALVGKDLQGGRLIKDYLGKEVPDYH